MKVKLTDAEIVTHLDSITRPTVVAAVASARRRLALGSDGLTKSQAKLVAAAVDEARAAGLLIHRGKPISRCSVCGKDAGYKLRKRDTPAGRKGSPMYGKPLYLRGVELAERFVTIRGHVSIGGCHECVAAVLPVIARELADLPTELRWPDEYQSPAVREPHCRCVKCEWSGRESKVGRSRALYDGTYPSPCPECGWGKDRPAFGPAAVKKVPGRYSVLVDGVPVREIHPQPKDVTP